MMTLGGWGMLMNVIEDDEMMLMEDVVDRCDELC